MSDISLHCEGCPTPILRSDFVIFHNKSNKVYHYPCYEKTHGNTLSDFIEGRIRICNGYTKKGYLSIVDLT